jgi:hypothetical protein
MKIGLSVAALRQYRFRCLGNGPGISGYKVKASVNPVQSRQDTTFGFDLVKGAEVLMALI